MKARSRKNLTFLSNQEIVEGMRNRSVRDLSRNRSIETNISLIEKKNYESSIQNQNTNPNTSFASTSNRNGSMLQNDKENQGREAQNQNLMKFLKENLSNKKLLSQVETFINDIPDNDKGGISKE